MKKIFIVITFVMFGLLMCPTTVYAESSDYIIEERETQAPSSNDFAINKEPVTVTPPPEEKEESSVVDVLGETGANIFKNNIVNFALLVILFIVLAAVMYKNKKSKNDTGQ